MGTLNYVIVESQQAYNNEIKLESGISIKTNTSIETVENINRVVKVVEAPPFTILEKGDLLVIHHNIMRLRNGMSGKPVESNYSLGDGKYYVPLTEIFMYKRNGVWKSLDPYCFVKPIIKEKQEKIGMFYISDSEQSKLSHKGKVKNKGILMFPNKELLEKGLVEGDIVYFTNHSEYEFNIENELYYKMSTRDIVAKD